MYTSLSQTTEDTKMVQSLVAVWEVCFLLYLCTCAIKMLIIAKPLCYCLQELEHLRLSEETKYTDLGRPSREEVLKDFLHGIKYESVLSMLFSQDKPHSKGSTTEESERLERCFKSLSDIVGTVTFSQDDYCDDTDVGNSAGMQNDKPNASHHSGSLKKIVQTMSPERISEYLVSSPVTQRTLSQFSDEGEKVVLTPQILVTFHGLLQIIGSC